MWFALILATGVVALVVATVVSGRRRRTRVMEILANPGGFEAAMRANRLHSFERERGPGPDPI